MDLGWFGFQGFALKGECSQDGISLGENSHRAPDGHAKEVTDTRSDNEVALRGLRSILSPEPGRIYAGKRARVYQPLQSMQMPTREQGTGSEQAWREKEGKEDRCGGMAVNLLSAYYRT